jgi:type IV secretory pathway TrbD component
VSEQPTRPTPHAVHASLVRAPLYLGVPRHVIGMEATLAFALVLGVGLRLTTLAIVLAIALVVHPAMVWLTAGDPMATEVAVRALRYADYYAPHALPGGRSPAPKSSVPTMR